MLPFRLNPTAANRFLTLLTPHHRASARIRGGESGVVLGEVGANESAVVVAVIEANGIVGVMHRAKGVREQEHREFVSRSFVNRCGRGGICAVDDVGELRRDVGEHVIVGRGVIVDVGAKQVADIGIAEIMDAFGAVGIGLIGAGRIMREEGIEFIDRGHDSIMGVGEVEVKANRGKRSINLNLDF